MPCTIGKCRLISSCHHGLHYLTRGIVPEPHLPPSFESVMATSSTSIDAVGTTSIELIVVEWWCSLSHPEDAIPLFSTAEGLGLDDTSSGLLLILLSDGVVVTPSLGGGVGIRDASCGWYCSGRIAAPFPSRVDPPLLWLLLPLWAFGNGTS